MIVSSAFEILGPIMVGPSSSHTAGALRMASVARSLAPAPIKAVHFVLYDSFAFTKSGHGTDCALVAGILGMTTDDPQIKHSFEIAKEQGLSFSFSEGNSEAVTHPNTVDILLTLADGTKLTLRGESVGGGRVRISQIEGVDVDISGEYVTLFTAHQDIPGMIGTITSSIASFGVNIAAMRSYRTSRGGMAYTVLELDEHIGDSELAQLNDFKGINYACLVDIPGVAPLSASTSMQYGFSSGASLLEQCHSFHMSISELMRQRESSLMGSQDAADVAMQRVIRTMKEAAKATITDPQPSLGGFLFDQARRLSLTTSEHSLLGSKLSRATAYAMATLERSSAMGVIVAAPTAGASGVLPGSLIAVTENDLNSDERFAQALWSSSAIGALVSTHASVSGAEGGCQAEIGTASAMTACALAELGGASPEMCLDAAAIALGNTLGLVCDPAQGLVEYPCQNRNALGVANAFISAQLALAGIRSAAPFDEVVEAQRVVGESMPASLRETAQGGLASCPSVCKACSCV